MSRREEANPFLDIDRRIVGDAGTSDEVGRNLHELCDRIGPRFAGTEGYRKAAEFMRDRFKAYGLARAQLESFTFPGWRRGAPARLRLVTPVARDFPCLSLPYGAATGPEGIKAAWIAIGGADDLEALGRRIRGRLVLAEGRGGHRQEIQARCAAAGAAGVLYANPAEGMVLHTGSVASGQLSPIPAVSIARETAAELRRWAADGGTRLHLFTDGAVEPCETWNVVGEWRGVSRPEERVIIGGHLDSHDIGPGAYDNAAGVLLVMEVARLLAPHRRRLKRTIRFVGFAAEELGLHGSHHHARAHAAALRKTRFMLNCDTPALGRPHGLAFHRCARAEAWVARLAAQMGEEISFANRFHRFSDHYPFLRRGVLTAGVGGRAGLSRGGAFSHMAADTPDKLAVGELRDTAAFAARIMLRAAGDEAWPALKPERERSEPRA